MSSLGTLLVRCDASIATGTGHMMRCLALAQAWQDAAGCAVFAMAEVTASVESRLKAEGFELQCLIVTAGSQEDAQETLRLAREQQAEWIVVDGYCFGSDFQAALKTAKQKVLFIDDNGHAGHYSADFVLNFVLGHSFLKKPVTNVLVNRHGVE